MNHPISDALTADEARDCPACLLVAVTQHDRRGDTRKLLSDVLTTVELATALADGVPDDRAWPEYGEIVMPGAA